MTDLDDAQTGPEARIVALVDVLHRTYGELRTLVGPEADAVMHLPSATAYAFPETQRELSRMEAAQRGHAAERAAILDAMPAQVAIVDDAGLIVAVNQSWLTYSNQINGVATSAKVGNDYIAFCMGVQGRLRATFLRATVGLNQVLSGQTDLFVLHYRGDAPGMAHWYQLTMTPRGQGPRRGAVIMNVDVSEHHRADAREADLQGRIERLVDQAPIGILVHQNFTPILANMELARLFGFSGADDILGIADWRDLIDPDGRDVLTSYAAARIAGAPAPNQYHMTGRHLDGRKITLEVRAFLIQ